MSHSTVTLTTPRAVLAAVGLSLMLCLAAPAQSQSPMDVQEVEGLKLPGVVSLKKVRGLFDRRGGTGSKGSSGVGMSVASLSDLRGETGKAALQSAAPSEQTSDISTSQSEKSVISHTSGSSLKKKLRKVLRLQPRNTNDFTATERRNLAWGISKGVPKNASVWDHLPSESVA